MSTALNKTLSAEGVLDAIDFTFYPWGNAYYNTSKCGTSGYDKQVGMTCWVKECGGDNPPQDCFKGDVLCQHGDGECNADSI